MSTVSSSMTFDQLQRYRLGGEMIDAVRDRKVFRILDAGSREGFLRSYLPEDRIVNLDRGIFSGDGFLRGDALSLPFPDQAFDVAVNIDVLEHLSPPDRPGLLSEMDRVSRRAFIVGAPFQSDEVTQAEDLAAAFSLRIQGRENEFLREHRREGIPQLQEVLEWGATRGYRTAVVPNGYLPRWLMMISLNEYLGRLSDPWAMIFAANRLYHEQFYRADNAAPAYRQMILFGKEGVFDPAE
ncbi:MAG: class I SAM-dependent methyltransferase, partial [PVC group bacterium]